MIYSGPTVTETIGQGEGIGPLLTHLLTDTVRTEFEGGGWLHSSGTHHEFFRTLGG